MIDGARLASTAKHAPETLDPNDVRYAGRVIERYESLLRSLRSWSIGDDGTATLWADLPADVAAGVIADWADVIGGLE